MADKEDRASSSLGSNGLLWVLLAALGTAALQQAPLLVEHPAGIPSVETVAGADRQRDARLWQDPFGLGVASHDPNAAHIGTLAGVDADALAQTLDQHRDSQSGNAPLLLVGTLPGGPYAEMAERRRRTRVAVADGLLAEGYVAEDSQHLHLAGTVPFEWYVRPDSLEAAAVGNDGGGAIVRPGVLVAWVAESSLMPHPRALLCGLLGKAAAAPLAATKDAQAAPSGACPSLLDNVVVLGPATSEALEASVHELEQGAAPQSPCAPNAAAERIFRPAPHFYTAMATLTLECLHGAPGTDSGLDAHSPNAGLQAAGITRTIATDEQLAAMLVTELANRGVNPLARDELAPTVGEILDWNFDRPDDAVALVTEADTPYGRGMPDVFCRSFVSGSDPADGRAAPCLSRSEVRSGLFLFNYLRGLNGELRQTSAKDSAPAATGSNGSEATGSAPGKPQDGSGASTGSSARNVIQRAEGDAQTDYLERLADRMRDLDRRLRSDAANPRALRAIGLLGTDVYDKLMLLRALKPRFPGVVFFTTDLDARLLDRSELLWTRNLVIASGFGLRLADSVPAGMADPHPTPALAQLGFPDFRDSYQTASYLTTRIAVRAPKGDLSARELSCLDELARQTHLYEIGRLGLNELVAAPGRFSRTRTLSVSSSIPGASALPPEVMAAHDCDRWGLAPASIDHADSSTAARQRIGLSLAFFGLFATGMFWGRPRMRAAMVERSSQRPSVARAAALWRGFGLTLLAALAIALLAWRGWPWLADWLSQGGRGQPIALLAGISVWPALLIVLCATLYWSWVAGRVSARLRENLCEIHHDFRFPGKFDEVRNQVRQAARKEARWLRYARDFFPPSLLPPPPALSIGDASGAAPRQPIPAFWLRYLRGGLTAARARRVMIFMGLMLIVFWILNDPLGNHLPVRGAAIETLYTGINTVALYLLLALMLLVAESSLFCSDFLDHLPEAANDWPAEALAHLKQERGISGALAVPWLQVQLTAERTAAITPLIYHPFIFLAILIFSHSTLFSPWKISMQHLVVVAATALAMLFCAIKLRSAAEAVRSDSIDRIEAALQRMRGADAAASEQRERARALLRAIRQNRVGALAPFSEQALIRSLILPLLSLAGSTAADLASLWQ